MLPALVSLKYMLSYGRLSIISISTTTKYMLGVGGLSMIAFAGTHVTVMQPPPFQTIIKIWSSVYFHLMILCLQPITTMKTLLFERPEALIFWACVGVASNDISNAMK